MLLTVHEAPLPAQGEVRGHRGQRRLQTEKTNLRDAFSDSDYQKTLILTHFQQRSLRNHKCLYVSKGQNTNRAYHLQRLTLPATELWIILTEQLRGKNPERKRKHLLLDNRGKTLRTTQRSSGVNFSGWEAGSKDRSLNLRSHHEKNE